MEVVCNHFEIGGIISNTLFVNKNLCISWGGLLLCLYPRGHLFVGLTKGLGSGKGCSDLMKDQPIRCQRCTNPSFNWSIHPFTPFTGRHLRYVDHIHLLIIGVESHYALIQPGSSFDTPGLDGGFNFNEKNDSYLSIKSCNFEK